MYGFLRIPACRLEKSDSLSYQKSYCGQCAALQQHFGYTARATVSYDMTLIGLLIDAQTPTPQVETTAWCAMFPHKVPVYRPDSQAQSIAAALSVMLLYAKLSDALQEKPSVFKKLFLRMYQPKFTTARHILETAGFPSHAMDRLLAAQAEIETQQNCGLQAYAEPSAQFCGEMFQFTAELAGVPENAAILYKIGYHIGRVIYLTDSCIDIADDKAKQQFNALLAAHLEGEQLRSDAQQEIVFLVSESLQQLQILLGQLRLYKHEHLITGIVLQGFPARLHQQVQRSFQKLRKSKLFSGHYLPHAALTSVLCLFATEANAAGWVWGKDENTCKTYGFSCASFFSGLDCIHSVDACCNPFVISINLKEGENLCLFYGCQSPKWIFTAGLFLSDFKYPADREFQSVFIPMFLIASVIVILWLPIQLISDSINYVKTQAAQTETQTFIKKTTPELSARINEMGKMLTQAESELKRLEDIKTNYPRQQSLVQPRIQSWQQVQKQLLDTQKQIELQTERAFVVYQVNQGSQDFEKVAQGLVKQADEALNMAKQIESAVKETIPR
ncbi:MAG: DUF5685 family protein [Thiotrichaceae bacterium]|nr:DUF5685 family protein [Thiotrichaceae bacterium]